MLVIGEVGSLTAALETAATAIGAGVVAGGFVAASARRLVGHSRTRWEGDTLGDGFWGGLWGMFCLCMDLLFRYIGWP